MLLQLYLLYLYPPTCYSSYSRYNDLKLDADVRTDAGWPIKAPPSGQPRVRKLPAEKDTLFGRFSMPAVCLDGDRRHLLSEGQSSTGQVSDEREAERGHSEKCQLKQ